MSNEKRESETPPPVEILPSASESRLTTPEERLRKISTAFAALVSDMEECRERSYYPKADTYHRRLKRMVGTKPHNARDEAILGSMDEISALFDNLNRIDRDLYTTGSFYVRLIPYVQGAAEGARLAYESFLANQQKKVKKLDISEAAFERAERQQQDIAGLIEILYEGNPASLNRYYWREQVHVRYETTLQQAVEALSQWLVGKSWHDFGSHLDDANDMITTLELLKQHYGEAIPLGDLVHRLIRGELIDELNPEKKVLPEGKVTKQVEDKKGRLLETDLPEK